MTVVLDKPEDIKTYFVGMVEQFVEADHEPILRSFLQDLQVAHGIYFDVETSPEDVKWPELAESTIQRKGHSIILYETGRLESSLREVTGDSIRVLSVGEGPQDFIVYGTAVPYSFFHQEGTSRMPQRMHVGMHTELVNIFMEKVADAAVAVMAKEN